MTKNISRRQFIQLSALTGTAVAVSGCTINLQRHETIETFVIPPEEALPGESIYYATACRMCSAGCGVLVRVSNGRARKIEGNPLHPLNAGKTCARGQAGLQFLYNPDRLQNAVRNEARGSGGGSTDPFGGRYGLKATPIQWGDAINELAQRIQSARPGAVAFYGSRINDSLADIVRPFLQAIGGQPPIFYDPEDAFAGRGTLARLMTQYFGAPDGAQSLPFFHLSTSDVVFSFGGPLLDGGMSTTAYNRSYGEMRANALGKRGFLVQFEPRMSPMGAVADEWVPILPGTEGIVALALGRIMVDEGIGNAANSVLPADSRARRHCRRPGQRPAGRDCHPRPQCPRRASRRNRQRVHAHPAAARPCVRRCDFGFIFRHPGPDRAHANGRRRRDDDSRQPTLRIAGRQRLCRGARQGALRRLV
ncbi:MAG: twin-arginine translocation signal domain-containing protein [Anaerolineae bacterium]|nr:twin-arginine translocation signal domain-containing protein [Anaerolineae bacterium]